MTSIIKIDILNQIIVIECEILYKVIGASESLVYFLLFSICRKDCFNFIAKFSGYFYDGIIIRVDVFDDISIVIIRVYIFENIIAIRSLRIVCNSLKKAR